MYSECLNYIDLSCHQHNKKLDTAIQNQIKRRPQKNLGVVMACKGEMELKQRAPARTTSEFNECKFLPTKIAGKASRTTGHFTVVCLVT